MTNFSVGEQQSELSNDAVSSLMIKVYNWMAVGLLSSAFSAYLVLINAELYSFAAKNMMLLVIVELAMVFGLSFMINKIKASTAFMVFIGYSLLNGLTIGVILAMYTHASVASTFFTTALMFGSMSVYGYVTKRDLTKIGSFFFMGLIGIIIASVINIFLHSPALYWSVSILGVFIFIGLTAFDTQKIKALMISSHASGDEESIKKISIIGALTLYLDFINLFLLLLRFMGSRRN